MVATESKVSAEVVSLSEEEMSVSAASFAKAKSSVNCDKKNESERSNVLLAECDQTAML